jgi:hypothetical protein
MSVTSRFKEYFHAFYIWTARVTTWSKEADIHSAWPCASRNQTLHYYTCKSRPLSHIQSQLDPIHTLTYHFWNPFLQLRLCYQISSFLAGSPTKPLWVYLSSFIQIAQRTWWRVDLQIVNLLNLSNSAASSSLLDQNNIFGVLFPNPQIYIFLPWRERRRR